MSAGYGGGFPDGSGGQGPGGRGNDPYAPAPSAADRHDAPFADPCAVGPDGTDPYATDPYAVGPDGTDPYATDPLAADGFAPVFGEPERTSWQGQGAAPYAAPTPAAPHPMGPPPYGAFAPPQPSSGSAIAGFVLGVLGLVMCGGLTSPFGIWFSAVGMKETGPTATTARSGRGLAIAGLVTSLIGLIPLLLMLFYVVVMVIAVASSATV